MKFTEDQILALAPDEASKKAGRDLAAPAKWVSKAASEKAIWGECQGSGSKPYQTIIDLNTIAFKCSCPSRKFPCKHGLGLLLLSARQPNLFSQTDMPLWVIDWIEKRGEKEVKKVEKTEKPVDENAQLKRQQAREQKVNAGIGELQTWLKDIVRGGILSMPEKAPSFWDNMGRRLIDNQAGGLANMVKLLGATKFWNEDWQSGFIDQLTRLYLVAKGYERYNQLNASIQQDIRSAIGFNYNQEELKNQTGINDNWLVVAREIRDEQQLSIEENWLYGFNTNSFALILQFYVRGQTSPVSLPAGMLFEAEIVYFPSALPLRALIKNIKGVVNTNEWTPKSFAGWQQVAEYESELNSKLPFRSDIPVCVENITPIKYLGKWWLQDQDRHVCKLPEEYTQIWKLLALSAGQPLTMTVIGSESIYKPIGVWEQNNYKPLI